MSYEELTGLCCNLVRARLVSDGASVSFLTPHHALRTWHSDGLPAVMHSEARVIVETVTSVLHVRGQAS